MSSRTRTRISLTFLAAATALASSAPGHAQQTAKPVLHGQHWIAITGKPLAATAGAMIFQQGGNAVDAAAAMLAATATMWDVLSWGGETQALIYHPGEERVIGINALGVAPTNATPEYYRGRDMAYPPEYGPLAAVTPGTPGGLLVMLAEYGSLSLEAVLAPAIRMADGYPIEAQTADRIEAEKRRIREWPYTQAVQLPHLGADREAPYAGEVFRQPDLAATLRKLVEAEQQALAAGRSRRDAIMAAYDRFYRGDIAREFVRGTQEQGGLITMEDLDRWRVHIEEPLSTTYRDIEVYKLNVWTQGPVLLQALNILEDMDVRAMGYNSARYIHALYQSMSLAFADRDFYYGDPYFPPEEPVEGLLSKEYARSRAATIDWTKNDPDVRPGDPYPYQNGTNPFLDYLRTWRTVKTPATTNDGEQGAQASGRTLPRSPIRMEQRNLWYGMARDEAFYAGTTSIQAADADGWVVSITPSGGWVPAVIAGRTGVGLSQRLQSFVLDPAENPYNVMEPGKRPRVTLTPSMALRDGRPFLSFAVQGGDSQDQNLLQFFLNVVEFDMNVQQAAEAANINSFQMRSSFGDHVSEPGRLLVQQQTPPWIIAELRSMGYRIETGARTSGPINAIFFDRRHGTFWGGSSHHGEDYGIAW
jgi:gamma-glutamyltranspeptidase / glutathione hydrolase